VCVSCVDEFNLLCFEECNVVELAAVAAVADVAKRPDTLVACGLIH